ncbi:MAG: hypothetical protein ABI377_09715 [Devosia sp.]
MLRMTMIGLALVCGLVPAAAYAKNGANDYLMAQSTSGQASLLSKAIGRGCTVKSVFFMGTGAPNSPKNQAFWSTKCSNGASFIVKVNPDGSNQAIECTVFEAMNGIKCFKKLPDATAATPLPARN